MTAYLIRRLLQMALVILLSATFTYTLFNYSPGGPLQGMRQSQVRLTPEDFARERAKFELDLYGPIRFSRWLIGFPSGPIVIGGRELFANIPIGCYMYNDQTGECADPVYLSELPTLHPAVRSSHGILRGDFGLSTKIRPGRPAIGEIMSRLRPTLELMITSTILALMIGIPIGIYSAVRQYSRFDYLFSTLTFFGSSMPVFFTGLLLILLFSVMPVFLRDTYPWLPSLPPGGREAVRAYEIASWLPRIEPGTLVDRSLRLLMPLAVLTFTGVATWSRFVRSSMLEVLRQDYVRTARAKGLVERFVISKHALRNALIPFVTVLVLQIPNIFAGAILTETIFAWPGMGQLYFNALNQNDYPIALAFIFITAVLTVIATLLGDILYTIVDPRIRYA
ncbi:MAG TPA: ABC transporter permease [Caldilineaceae bacterium]|nr:ABC transporter permease [Caldilineaceae bacterium]